MCPPICLLASFCIYIFCCVWYSGVFNMYLHSLLRLVQCCIYNVFTFSVASGAVVYLQCIYAPCGVWYSGVFTMYLHSLWRLVHWCIYSVFTLHVVSGTILYLWPYLSAVHPTVLWLLNSPCFIR